ncbi:glutathione S-transferase family protein [Leptolyngbya ohadii]|uniref:glutathione S-transferase family protein n=1 Tax=Leptolyngbya ohadii TaxID=1962290 RepID=UPI000B5A18E9|nr:glutathione S-transferase family protein [Leptolyngbya ohadii]
MIKLFYAPGTCAIAPHIVLEWIGQPYDLQKVKPRDPEYMKLNPLGQVPAMIDGDSGVMNQADALLKYLTHKYPEAQLGDNGTLQDAYELDRWLAFFTGDVHPAFYPFFAPQRYAPDDSPETQSQVKEKALALIDRVFKHLDAHLEGKDHLVGDRRTIADAYAFAMIRWGNLLPNRLTEYPNLARFYETMRQDEAVQRAMAQQGIKF